ncbi:N-acetylneuraminate synthase [Alteromonas sp. D210916BOD_24]|uniref:N-acetylneuraminate synthase n=1 Tax=Alteromonas sp. D210916BOD_24 TaxID=3157618 RepID=UPI00399CCFD5
MTVIIAEAGVNHNGSAGLAFKLIDEAHKAGADIIKFQTFKAENLVTAAAQQARYQQINTQKSESQLAMLKRLELAYETHHQLVAHCKTLGIAFMSTAFDLESLEFLTQELGLTTLKIASGELTNAPLLLAHARTGCKLIVSTGMSTLADIESALGVIAFGFVAKKNAEPSVTAFAQAYASEEGQKALKEKVTLLHCTTEYPAPFDEINLRAMDTLQRAFDLPAGYSDHSEGIAVPLAAAARGAQIIEKHFTLDKGLPGPDHKASLNPVELHAMIAGIRQIDVALGSPVKSPSTSEYRNRSVARKCLVAACDIPKGAQFNSTNVAIKRAGEGLSPYDYWRVMGSTANRNYTSGERIVD